MSLCEGINSITIICNAYDYHVRSFERLKYESMCLADGSTLLKGPPSDMIRILSIGSITLNTDLLASCILVPRETVSIKDYSDILGTVQNLTIIAKESSNVCVCIDLEGIESLSHLKTLSILKSFGIIRVNSLQGIEFCANLQELYLENVKTPSGDLSLAPLTGLELEKLVLKGTYRDLSSIKTKTLVLSISDRAQLVEVLDKPGFVVQKIILEGYTDILTAEDEENAEDFELMSNVQEHIRQWNSTAVVEYEFNDPRRGEPDTLTLDEIISCV